MIPESELVEILSRLLANPRENEVFELKEAKGPCFRRRRTRSQRRSGWRSLCGN